ncbi:MAG: 5-nucleotidase [Marmoricola sp.]|nr:5-nucleotidase [Marmoricola sp.]
MPHARIVSGITAVALSLVSAAALAAPADAKPAPKPKAPLTGHLLAFNDFHGQIDPPTGSGGLVSGTPAGGVEYLSTYVKQRRAAAKKTSSAVFTVAAGDLVGASPLVSAAFHDEPAVEEMNSLGLDVTSVGNHEFDEGVAEVQRLQKGGCHPTDGCQDGDGFAGAKYPMLAANVVYKKNNLPILAPFTIKRVGGVPVAFVGMTLEGTPGIVNPAGIQNVKFLDEAKTANAYAKILKTFGIKALVLLIHEGGIQSTPPATVDPNGCVGFSGAISGIVSQLDPAYGIVVSGHTHAPYNCTMPNSAGTSRVTSAGSVGTQLTDITFQVDPKTRMFVSATAENTINANGVKNPDGTWAKDPGGNFIRNTALVDPAAKVIADKYRVAVAPIANKVVGAITADVVRDVVPSGESPLGDVIADAQLAYTTASAGAQLALMNPGGIRASLIHASSAGGEAPGQVTYGEAFTVQPFNNLVVTQTFTGAQIKGILEQQFAGQAGQTTTKILQVSAGFTYTYSSSAPLGSKVSNLVLNGTPIDPAATYRVTSNDFLANGGDGFTQLAAGTNRAVAPGFDVDALASYLAAGVVAPGPANRITLVP